MRTSDESVAALARRAALACATADVCRAYLAAVIRFNEAPQGGAMTDDAAKVRLLTKQAAAFRAFLAAWHQGEGAADNLHVAECAVRSFVRASGASSDTEAAAECWLLDAVVGPMRRLPEPDLARAEDQQARRTDPTVTTPMPAAGGLSASLAALLAAVEADAGDRQRQHAAHAMEGVRGAVETALHGGVEAKTIQAALDSWAKATGGPRVVLNVNPA